MQGHRDKRFARTGRRAQHNMSASHDFHQGVLLMGVQLELSVLDPFDEEIEDLSDVARPRSWNPLEERCDCSRRFISVGFSFHFLLRSLCVSLVRRKGASRFAPKPWKFAGPIAVRRSAVVVSMLAVARRVRPRQAH